MSDKKLYKLILNGWELPAIQSVVAEEKLWRRPAHVAGK